MTVLRRYFVGGGQRFSLSPVFLSENTSRTRARRVAEVSSSKECCTIGSKDKFCRKELEWGLTSSNLCSLNSSSPCLTTFQLWPPLLSSSQFSQPFSAVLIFFISSHLSSPLFTSSQLFSTLLNESHRCPSLLNSSRLFSPLATSSQLLPRLLTSAELISPLLSSSHDLTSSKLFSSLLTSITPNWCFRDPSQGFTVHIYI